MPARKNPVKNRAAISPVAPIPPITIPRLKRAAINEQMKNTHDGAYRSEMPSRAKRTHPPMNPNCTALVRWARNPTSRWWPLSISGAMAFPANHSEVHRNCEITITGNIRFMLMPRQVLSLILQFQYVKELLFQNHRQ